MNTTARTRIRFVVAVALLCLLSVPLQAGQPGTKELEAAIKSGDFSGYLADATAWLKQKTPAKPDKSALDALLKAPVFRKVLNQRQLIAKTGAEKLGAFAKADPANREFLGWLMKNTEAMDLYLEACVPIGLAAREKNAYNLGTAALEIWKKILKDNPDAKDGIYLKLAIASAIAPPHSIGAGSADKMPDPVVRYKYYKTAHKNKELLPSFDNLSVWEYSHVVSSGASDADLTWGREMVNTFRPDLLVNERVVKATSLVWRRAAPAKFYPGGYKTFKNILAGGGKCGPKGSFAVFISQAFGIPAIGVAQPKHACAAYKSAYPMNQPQPGNAWKVDYGRGWGASRIAGLQGPDFLAGVSEREHAVEFSQVEHLRWLAAALAKPDRAAAVMNVAHAIQKSVAALKPDISPTLDEAAVKAAAAKAAAAKAAAVKEAAARAAAPPIKATAGVLHVEAASFAKTGGKISWGGQKPYVEVYDCHTGGKQVYFEQQMAEQWADYILDVPASGTYEIVMKAACVNDKQFLEVCSGDNVIATVPIPLKFGLWVETEPVELKLEKGVQTLRVRTTPKHLLRGITLRWFKLKRKGN